MAESRQDTIGLTKYPTPTTSAERETSVADLQSHEPLKDGRTKQGNDTSGDYDTLKGLEFFNQSSAVESSAMLPIPEANNNFNVTETEDEDSLFVQDRPEPSSEDLEDEPDDTQWEEHSNSSYSDLSDGSYEANPSKFKGNTGNGLSLKSEFYEVEQTVTKPEKGAPAKGAKKSRRLPCKSAREFWTRWNEDNKNRELKRKKSQSVNIGSNKRQKAEATPALQKQAQKSALPAMETFHATTKEAQTAQFRAHMAPEGDTRRKNTQLADFQQASKSFGYKRCVADGKESLLRNTMSTSLRPFQLPVAAWMCRREVCADPAGGLLADDMGIGKTVSTLACISEHWPEQEDIDEYGSATLIVVPNRIVAEQWLNEVKKHCIGVVADGVAVYTRKSLNAAICKQLRVVIATYAEVSSQWPSKENIGLLTEKYGDDYAAFEEVIEKDKGPLFQGTWYRVVLDEAHHIKNRNAQVSIAVCQFTAKYRWCLSGTPLSNSQMELFPYLRFLKCCFTEDKYDFNRKYVNGVESAENFEALISMIMYRRTQKDDFFDHKIIDLPDSTYEDIWVPLSVEEEMIAQCIVEHLTIALEHEESDDEETAEEYCATTAMETTTEAMHNPQGQKPNQTEENEEEYKPECFAGTTTMAAISHPFNLENLMRTKLSTDAIGNLKENLAKKGGKRSVAEHLLASIEGSKEIEKYTNGISLLQKFEENVFGGSFSMDTLLELVLNEHLLVGALCPICKKSPRDPMGAYECDHIYCSAPCMNRLLQTQMRTGMMARCKSPDCQSLIFDPQVESAEMRTLGKQVKDAYDDKAYREGAEDCLGTKICQKREKNGFFTMARRCPEIDISPSAKTSMAMSVILQWQAKHPGDKILVFTQFLMTGKILGYMLQQAGIDHLYYYGECGEATRHKAIERFNNDPEIKIMLMGLRAGSTALNLTAANRVVLVDPWWNDTVEQQAFGRVKRMGQTKEMKFVRILCNTVDDIISRLQNSKSAKVGYALQDDGHTPVAVNDERMTKLFMDPMVAKKSQKGNKIDRSDPKEASHGPPVAHKGGKDLNRFLRVELKKKKAQGETAKKGAALRK